MNPHRDDPRPDAAAAGRSRREPATALRADEPMDDEACLFVLSLLMDGRVVPADLAARAREYAELHPACQEALADFEAIHGALSGSPTYRADEGFTERALERSRQDAAGGEVFPMIGRLAAAAALLLALTLVFDAGHPGDAVAGDEIEHQRYTIDDFRPDAFGPVDLDAGLEALLPDPPPFGEAKAARLPGDPESLR